MSSRRSESSKLNQTNRVIKIARLFSKSGQYYANNYIIYWMDSGRYSYINSIHECFYSDGTRKKLHMCEPLTAKCKFTRYEHLMDIINGIEIGEIKGNLTLKNLKKAVPELYL